MQHARRMVMSTLALALATSSVALAAGDPESDRGAVRSEPPTTDSAGHHGPAPAPAPPTTAETDAELATPPPVESAGGVHDGARWGERLERGQVERVQRALSSRGIYRGTIDGIVGPQTLAALQNFQAQQGLPAHARLDAQTRRALGLELDLQPVSGKASAGHALEPSVGRDTASEPGMAGSGATPLKLETLDPQQLGQLQTRLAELGFYRGSVDGKPGAGTRSALQRFFQAQAELASRGMLTEAAASVLGIEPRATRGPSGSMGSNELPATMPHPQPSTP